MRALPWLMLMGALSCAPPAPDPTRCLVGVTRACAGEGNCDGKQTCPAEGVWGVCRCLPPIPDPGPPPMEWRPVRDGGPAPCLTTTPLDQLAFSGAMTVLPVTLANGAPCGPLLVHAVSVSASPFFSIVEAPAPDTVLAPGESVDVKVEFHRPLSGGTQLSDLRLTTDDPAFGPPQWKLMLLVATAPFDSAPVPSLHACTPSDLVAHPDCAGGPEGTVNVSLASLNPAVMTLSAIGSSDDHRVAAFRFTLLPPLPGGALLLNSGQRLAANVTTLSVAGTGTYRVGLEVWDDVGQQSAASRIITINVAP